MKMVVMKVIIQQNKIYQKTNYHILRMRRKKKINQNIQQRRRKERKNKAEGKNSLERAISISKEAINYRADVQGIENKIFFSKKNNEINRSLEISINLSESSERNLD